MRVLVNALSVTNLSGRHVLLGHLSRLAQWTTGQHDYFVLYHKANKDICRDLGKNVKWIQCPVYTGHWVARILWERTLLKKVLSKYKIDLLFNQSGTVVPSLPIRQISYAMNPWCLVLEVERKPLEKIKAFLQRRSYRQAMSKADMMLFLSGYMQQAYRKNSGFEENTSEVLYTAINEDTHKAAERHHLKSVQKKPAQILSVSMMAPHKGVETLVRAVHLLRKFQEINANLVLIGSWPDHGYEKKVHNLVNKFGLEDEVSFKGHVPRQELHRYYAESKIFCLMSWCESFGIPAVEAQAFGTPVISSNCCAIPEVCGNGGLYPEPGDFQSVAAQMARLLMDDNLWLQLSNAAIKNAQKYHWDNCSRPLKHIFDKFKI